MRRSKVIYTLNIGNYAPDICAVTYPFIQRYADKIGAEFKQITERKYPEWPVTFEKLQLYQLSEPYEWTYYIDSDALVHPDFMDVTNHITVDTVCQNAKDVASHRFKYDEYFLRDSRHIGSCNWFTVAGYMCRDLWHYPDDLTPAQAEANIFPTRSEIENAVTPGHLIDDYMLSYNIARYGLKYRTVAGILEELGYGKGGFVYHCYGPPEEEKLAQMKKVLKKWKLN